MEFSIGDVVSRNSHNNDILFHIVEIKEDLAILKGVDLRLYADSFLDDLKKEQKLIDSDRQIIEENLKSLSLDRSEYFYLPGRVLHVDGDQGYLERCIKFYHDMNIQAYGINIKEVNISKELPDYLKKYNPDILVITGHDAYYRKSNDSANIENYQNTKNFINAVREARLYEKCHDKLILIAGACQSNYEELIKAGANFASSPKRINIHALDPAIIATSISLTAKNKEIDLLKIIEKTKYGSDGIGGIITTGTMYMGYPR